jgi:anti-sigma factor RsiW
VSSPCDQLHIFADGELAVAERPAFHRHLTTCSACREGLENALMLDVLATSFSDARAPDPDGVPAPSARAAPPLPQR